MAGRGRGRGRGRGTSLFINKDMKELLSAQGVGRADEIPPPLYDKAHYTRPGSLITDSDQDYLVKVKQLFREACRNLPYHLKVQTNKKDVECYSDKYLINDCQPLQPDWSRLPAELNDTVKRKRKRPAKNAPPFKKAALPTVTSQLDELEKNETWHDEEEPEEGLKKNAEGEVEEDEETVDEDEYDEVELEEDNDYAKNYYESDESRGDDEDDNLDADGYY